MGERPFFAMQNLFSAKNLVDASSILAKLPFFLDANNLSMLLFHSVLFAIH